MYAEVILSQRFPKHLGIFDYKVPDSLVPQIKIGQLVTIPFRKSEREGVIVQIKETVISGKRIKKISQIIQSEPILTLQQIELANWLANYYFISQGTVLKTMLPPVPKKISHRHKKTVLSSIAPPQLTNDINKLITRLSSEKNNSLLFYPNNKTQKEQFIYHLLKKITGTILIIVPDLLSIIDWQNTLPVDLLEKSTVIHSQLNKNQYYNNWQQIINNKKSIIIGTKLALFAPFHQLQTIIIDQEENQNHKQSDQNPRYDSRLVAEKLAKLSKSKIIKISPCPTVSAYHDILTKNSTLLKTSELKTIVNIIDLKDERKKGNYSIFSENLQDQSNQLLEQKKQIFYFINKRGGSSSVICRDCSQLLLCDKCNNSLVHHQTSNFLYCHQCNKKNELPPFCSKCSGTNFKFIGTGTQKVEAEANKLWPKAQVVRLDKDITKPSLPHKFDIIIGTEFAFNYINWNKIALTAVISADTFLHLPDYRSTERTWQMLSKIQYLNTNSIIIQTYSPDNKVINSLQQQNIEQFYQDELNDRKTLDYPPYSSLIKLIYQNSDKETCLTETKKIHTKLNKYGLRISLLTPLNTLVRNKWQMYLIIKFKSPGQNNLVNKIINEVPDNWIIDRDPNNLL